MTKLAPISGTPIEFPGTLLLFVHGLSGKKVETWGNFPKLIAEDPAMAGCTWDFYGYPTMLIRLPFQQRSAKIQELARGLKTYIDRKCKHFNQIILVAHSMGGLICKRYLIAEIKNGNLPKVIGLVLYGVPNNGAALARGGGLFSWGHRQLAQLGPYSDVIDAISEDWSALKIANTVQTKYVIGGGDKIVSPESAMGFQGNQNTETAIEKNHRTVCKPEDINDISYIILRDFVRDLTCHGEKTAHLIQQCPESGRSEEALFEVYRPELEQWYVQRDEDHEVTATGSAMNLWISGPTGTGKTASIQRFLDLGHHRYAFVSLAGYGGESSETLFRAIGAAIGDIAGLEGEPSDGKLHTAIKQIVVAAEKLTRNEVFFLFVEEIPISNHDEFICFVSAIYSLLCQLSAAGLHTSVKILLSSIADPRPYIQINQEKIHEKMRFIEFHPWGDDACRELIKIIETCFKIEVRESEAQILQACRGSPRFIKRLFRTHIRGFRPELSLRELIPLVAAEVFHAD